MPTPVQCPSCHTDGTAAANEQIRQQLGGSRAVGSATSPTSTSISLDQRRSKQTRCRACKKQLTGREPSPLRSEDGVFCSQECIEDFNNGIGLVLPKKAAIIGALTLLGIGVALGVWAIKGLATGEVFMAGTNLDRGSTLLTRSRDPILYWTSISMALLFFLLLCGIAPIWFFRYRKHIRFS